MARADDDRNILFGLLARRTGLIDQQALAEAFRSWFLDRSRDLADLLTDHGSLPASRRSLLEALVCEHIEDHGGDPSSSLATLGGQATPDTLTRSGLAEREAALGRDSSGATDFAKARSIGSREDDPAMFVDRRYRLLRPHASGGLGSVHVALDTELNREVAIKQILERHAEDPNCRARFLLEAEITGGLEHPGIVPVYGLGTFEDGRPFYAMRFIQGDSLKLAIAKFHRVRTGSDPHPAGSRELELRKLLRRFIDVCNAIEYAHGRGILHRDLKPDNVMVGNFGETLVVDWGLAKVIGAADAGAAEGERTLNPSASGGSFETLPGSAIGTPAYMSPEQAAGDIDRLGPLSDVYSLGATLYCLLTGRPPYEGGGPAEVLNAVLEGKLTPPRERVPTIDRALEAVCLAAMAHRPEDRYPSPSALAEEIDRWMADEPVVAFPEPKARRVARWARRHSAMMTGGGAFLAATVVGLAAILWLVARHGQSLDRAVQEARRQEVRAMAGSTMARRAVKEMLMEVSRDDLLNVPQAEPLRVTLAERALHFYRDFVRLNPGDPVFDLEHARIEEQVASLYRMTGKLDRAEAEYATTIAILQGLIARRPGSVEARDFLAYTRGRLGELVKQRGGGLAQAEPHYREAARIADGIWRDFPSEPKYAKTVALIKNDLADMLVIAGRPEEAEPLAREAVAAAMAHRGSLPEAPDPSNKGLDWIILPLARTTHGASLARLGRVAEAEVPLRAAIGTFRTLIRIEPAAVDPRFLLADASKELGNALARRQDRRAEALAALDEAVELVAPLLEEFPANAHYRRYLPMLRADRGAIRLEAGQDEPARDDLSFADDKLAARVRDEPGTVEPLREYGKVRAAQARLADRGGQPDRALALADEAQDLQQRALAIDPGSSIDRDLLEKNRAIRARLNHPIRK